MNGFPISTWRLIGAGLQTPPTPFRGPGGTAGLPTVPALETFGRRIGKVMRPCHNPVRDCEEVGKLFPSRSIVLRARRADENLNSRGPDLVVIVLDESTRIEELPQHSESVLKFGNDVL